jgi:hypothetical protein
VNMSPSSPSSASSSLDAIVSDLLSARRMRDLLSRNPRAKYALIAAVAALVAAAVELRRRAEKRDEVKRQVPHRRNSAMLLYDGSSFLDKGS